MGLAYADEGPGPVVSLLHGFPLSRAMWVEQLSGIGSTYRVIARICGATGVARPRRRVYHGRDGR